MKGGMPVGEEAVKKVIKQLLIEAEQAHAEYERKLGHRDENWPEWYAEFIVDKLKGTGFV